MAVKNDLTQGDGQDTYITLDTPSVKGMRDRPTGREAQSDGASILVRGRESRPHGEGRQVLEDPKTGRYARCVAPKPYWESSKKDRGKQGLPLQDIYRQLYNLNLT